MKVIKNFKAFCLSVGLIMISLSVGYGQKEWEKKFNFDNYNDALKVFQTQDSMYWISGFTGNFVSEKGYSYLLKLDNNGNKVFYKTFGNFLNYDGIFTTTSDNGVLLPLNHAIKDTIQSDSLVKIDKNGSILWQIHFAPIAQIMEVADKKIVIINDSISLLNQNGKLLWAKQLLLHPFVDNSYVTLHGFTKDKIIFSGVAAGNMIMKEINFPKKIYVTLIV
jgi:hypothetical protein